MTDLPRYCPPLAVWIILGLSLAITVSLVTGEGLTEELPLGAGGGFVGGSLYKMLGERRTGVIGAMVGAMALIAVFDVLKALRPW